MDKQEIKKPCSSHHSPSTSKATWKITTSHLVSWIDQLSNTNKKSIKRQGWIGCYVSILSNRLDQKYLQHNNYSTMPNQNHSVKSDRLKYKLHSGLKWLIKWDPSRQWFLGLLVLPLAYTENGHYKSFDLWFLTKSKHEKNEQFSIR